MKMIFGRVMNYFDVLRNIYLMRKNDVGLNAFREFITAAKFYADERSKKVRIGKHGFQFEWRGKRINYDGPPVHIVDTFWDEQYAALNVRHKTIIDIGCAYGDTMLYFMGQGASVYLGYDIDEYAIEKAKQNAINNSLPLDKVYLFCEKLSKLPLCKGAVLKMDCEGAEHSLIANSDMGVFDEIILEYHGRVGEIPKILEAAGFTLNISGQKHIGIIYARKGMSII